MSDYNSEKKEPVDDDYSVMCPANGCPMLSSVFYDGGPWTCRYHSKQPHSIWPKITDLIVESIRWFKIIGSADALTLDEYESIQSKKTWALDELIKPVKGESHPQWQHRVKDTVYKALKYKINLMAKADTAQLEGMPEKPTMVDLTSGILLSKKVKGDS